MIELCGCRFELWIGEVNRISYAVAISEEDNSLQGLILVERRLEQLDELSTLEYKAPEDPVGFAQRDLWRVRRSDITDWPGDNAWKTTRSRYVFAVREAAEEFAAMRMATSGRNSVIIMKLLQTPAYQPYYPAKNVIVDPVKVTRKFHSGGITLQYWRMPSGIYSVVAV